ncbi:MAG: MFS transporter [Magnetovibrio sp.]|nr:MFS transporter [Magnetovibrio sp.]
MADPVSLAPRRIAADFLDGVLRQRRTLDALLGGHPGLAALAPRDRAFARNLVTTTLRRLGQIDALIDHCLTSPLPRKAAGVSMVLRLGVCQRLFMGVADHAAVATAVDLVRDLGLHGYAKLVNAVLRRLGREAEELLGAQDAARLNTPGWLWDSWRAAYGDETAGRIAAAHLAEAPLDISARDDPSAWAGPLEAEVIGAGTLRRPAGGNVAELPGFADGAWWVQDAAARAVARMLGDVAGKRVIDLCAAPGGKTACLAAAGAAVTAVDRAPGRVRRLRENLARLNLAAEVVTADAAAWRPAAPADAVLLDAPCSATGTIRRHPDIPWTKSPDDVARLAALQGRLVDAAVGMLKPGGVLVFATCSLQPEEGPDQLAGALERHPALALDPVRAGELGDLAVCLDSGGGFRSLPCHLAERGGVDGFFAARLKRV